MNTFKKLGLIVLALAVIGGGYFAYNYHTEQKLGGTTVAVQNGGTGASFLSGCLTGNGTSPVAGTGLPCGGSGGISFTADTNYGVQVYSTTTPTLWFKAGLYASSTSYLAGIQVGNTISSDIGNNGGTLDAGTFPGADMGAKINAAYAACSSKGCRIFVPQPPTGTEWNYTTPISISTHFKPALLYCASGGGGTAFSLGGGTTLNYTPSTGDAITFNTNEYVIAGSGIENCDIHGPSGSTASATRGLVIGGTNGAFSFTMRGVTVSGFGTNIYLGSNTSFFSMLDSVSNFGGRLLSEPDTAGANCENMRISNSVLADANNQAGGATDLFGIYIQESGNCQWNVTQTSFDDAQWFSDQFGGTNNSHTFTNVHWENPNGHTYDFISTLTNTPATKINLVGGDMMNDVVGGMTEMISSGSHVTLSGGFSANNNNNVVTPVTRVVSLRDAATTNSVTWTGLQSSDIGATYVYGTVPFSNTGYGTGLGNPYYYVGSTGKFGIGTSSPRTVFEVVSNVSNTGTFSLSNTSTSGYSSIDLFSSAGAFVGGLGFGNSAVGNFRANSLYIGTVSNATPFYLNTGDTPRITILGLGAVGIGTTTPLATFQVATSTVNATTSIQFGKANQNKGTCTTEYDTAGSPVYSFYAAGAIVKTVQNGGTAPSGCTN